MTDTPGNVALVRELYDAFAKGDVPFVLRAMDPHIEWTEAEGLPYAGDAGASQCVDSALVQRAITP